MVRIAPSILAADWTVLADEVRAVESAGADLLHLDVMDGSFVPPITFGADFVRAVGRSAKVPLDVHLMIHQPERHVDAFIDAGAATVTVHVEVCDHLHRVVQHIHERGAKAGVALNPATPLSRITEILRDIDLMLIMTVNPGWGGQAFIDGSEKKIADAARMITESGRSIALEVDGGVNAQTAKRCVAAGADVLVAGSFIFQQRGSYQEAIRSLRS